MTAGPDTTPTLRVDTAVLRGNITARSDWARREGIALRPHAKTHKTAEIARQQVDAGAAGLTVATVGEAEAYAAAGFTDLFVAYPVWAGDGRGQRLAHLAEGARLRVGVDSAEGAAALGAVVPGDRVEALVEVDSGQHRSGVDPAAAGVVADAAARAGLRVVGVFTFPGHSYAPDGGPERAARTEAAALEQAAHALTSAGHEVLVRSGGSTPSASFTAAGVVNEIRPGVYVFNDAQQVMLGTCAVDDVALSAWATVVSVPGPDRFVLDSGGKILGADRPPWMPGFGLLPDLGGAVISAMSEHHAVVNPGPGQPLPHVGDKLRVIPNHVCAAVNLVDELTPVTNGVVSGSWPLIARGLNR